VRGVGFIAKHLANVRILAKGYTPERVDFTTWENQFSAGAWKRLEGETEAGRYSVMVGFCQTLSKKVLLDVGCGQGVLSGRLQCLSYERYVGLDLSPTAVQHAINCNSSRRNRFVVADAESFVPDERFDMIIFNECLYYFDQPIKLIERYMTFLDSSGHVLVSMYNCVRARSLWNLISRHMNVVDGGTFTHLSGASWTMKILAPTPSARFSPPV